MKIKTLLSILALGLIVSAFGQKPTMELTFMAKNSGQYVPMDSILIENLTQGGDTTLYAPDTLLVLNYITGFGDNGAIDENTFSVSQNYPNPFKGKTEVHLFLPEKDDIKITIRDILGRTLAHYENIINRGNHSFTFYCSKEKYYLLTITGKQTSKTIKMVNAGNHEANGEKCKIVYTGNNNNVSSIKSQNSKNDFAFSLGDEVMFTAYATTAIGNLGSAVIIDTPEMDTMYVFDIKGGLRCPGMPIITDIDGNDYITVLIGAQCWMKENLKTTTYQNGTDIPNVTDANAWNNLSTGSYVWYDNDISWKDSYGALYNWYATVDINGLCPTGWHVPTNVEWWELTDYIGGTDSPHGNELKSCRQVNSPLGGDCNTTEHPRWNEHNQQYGTDDYGFSGLPGGDRSIDGTFYLIGTNGIWWSSSQESLGTAYAWHRLLYYSIGGVSVNSHDERRGRSVRCLRDY